MPGTRLITYSILLGISSCNGGKPEDARIREQVELCQDVCIRRLCDPLYDPVFEDDPNAVCLRFCEESVAAADDEGCFAEQHDLLECLDDLSCGEVLLWYEQGPEAMCMSEEQTLASVCPNVEVPREAG